MDSVAWWFFGFVGVAIVVFTPIIVYMNKIITKKRKTQKWIHVQV